MDNFAIFKNEPNFVIDLKDSLLTEVGSYGYTVRAVAKGGKALSTSNLVEIKRVCRSGIKLSFDALKDKFNYFVPDNILDAGNTLSNQPPECDILKADAKRTVLLTSG